PVFAIPRNAIGVGEPALILEHTTTPQKPAHPVRRKVVANIHGALQPRPQTPRDIALCGVKPVRPFEVRNSQYRLHIGMAGQQRLRPTSRADDMAGLSVTPME